jgi:hypothetical protein
MPGMACGSTAKRAPPSAEWVHVPWAVLGVGEPDVSGGRQGVQARTERTARRRQPAERGAAVDGRLDGGTLS